MKLDSKKKLKKQTYPLSYTKGKLREKKNKKQKERFLTIKLTAFSKENKNPPQSKSTSLALNNYKPKFFHFFFPNKTY